MISNWQGFVSGYRRQGRQVPLPAFLADIRRRIELAEGRAHSLPHRERYLLLAHGLTLRLVTAYEEWLDDVERKFKSG